MTATTLAVLLDPAACGGARHESPLDAALRVIARHSAPHGDWVEKYGATIDTPVYAMHPFCWCDHDACGYCYGGEPLFHYKPTNVRVRWYKYIGRDTHCNVSLSARDVHALLLHCVGSEAALAAVIARVQEQQRAVRAALDALFPRER